MLRTGATDQRLAERLCSICPRADQTHVAFGATDAGWYIGSQGEPGSLVGEVNHVRGISHKSGRQR